MTMTAEQLALDCYRLLKQQGGPSIMDNGASCAYRGETGAKCAIGQYIIDEVYTEKIEHKSFDGLEGFPAIHEHLLRDYPALFETVEFAGIEDHLGCALQHIHDQMQPEGFIPGLLAGFTGLFENNDWDTAPLEAV